MTEDEARSWLIDIAHVPRETMDKIDAFAGLLLAEAQSQNLIAASTIDQLFARHIVDSAQLIPLAAEAGNGAWLDLGSGAGFPGLIVGLLTDRQVILVESRRKRIEFLARAIEVLGIGDRVSVEGRRLEAVPGRPVAVISARAFAPLERLIPLAIRFSRSGTLWLLPKGQNAQSELEAARKTWQGVFHVKQSVTDPNSSIIVARSVRRSTT